MQLASAHIWFVFRFWTAIYREGISVKKQPKPWWCRIRGPRSKTLCIKQVRLVREHGRLTKLVKSSCRSDFLELCMGKCRDLEEAALECCSWKMYGLLRNLKAWAPRRQRRLLDEDGFPAGTDHEERHIVKKHFQTKLDGCDTTMQALIDDDRSSRMERAPVIAAMDKSLEAVPSVTYLVGKMRMRR